MNSSISSSKISAFGEYPSCTSEQNKTSIPSSLRQIRVSKRNWQRHPASQTHTFPMIQFATKVLSRYSWIESDHWQPSCTAQASKKWSTIFPNTAVVPGVPSTCFHMDQRHWSHSTNSMFLPSVPPSLCQTRRSPIISIHLKAPR